MGEVRSGRWRGHTKRRLVEETPALELAALRSAGALEPGATGLLVWGPRVAQGWFQTHEEARKRWIEVQLSGQGAHPMRTRVELARRPMPRNRGAFWRFRCPSCLRYVRQMFLDATSHRVGCFRCLGLIHRSAQQHSALVDQAVRDPGGFLRARRQKGGGLRGELATARIISRAFEKIENRQARGRFRHQKQKIEPPR